MWPDCPDLRQSIHNINSHSSQIFANENENLSQKETIIEQNNKRYFQKKLNDRRQRTYDVLKQFDAELADFIISPGKRQPGRQDAEAGQKVRPRLSIFIKNRDLSIEENAAICLQAAARGYLQRRRYASMLAQKLMADIDQQNRVEAMRLEHWALEQENARLERQIEERNAQFRIRI
jgi:hypothetical protein